MGFGAAKPSTLCEWYLIPMKYVPAELALKLTVVTPFDVLMVESIFVQPDVYAKLLDSYPPYLRGLKQI